MLGLQSFRPTAVLTETTRLCRQGCVFVVVDLPLAVMFHFLMKNIGTMRLVGTFVLVLTCLVVVNGE
jgi:hypothetical protein